MNLQNWGHAGLTLANAGYYHSSLAAYRKALPEAENLYNLANVLRRLCRYEEAEIECRRSMAMHPGAQDPVSLLGCLRMDQGDFAGACELLQKTQHISGYNRFCYAIALLSAGRWEEGFREYDGRLTANDMPLPIWSGEPLGDRTVAITAEQGFGDTIMYSRFLEGLDFKHFFLCPNPLQRLIPGAMSGNISFQADFICPLMSLPSRLGVKELPPYKPYISPPVRFSLGKPVDTGLSIGLVWRSKSGGLLRKPEEIRHGQQKSIPLELLLPLTAIDGTRWYSLQTDEDINGDIARLGAGPLLENLGYRTMDFADTAGFLSELDLLVTVDTGPAHLAGAMGKPTILMLNYASSWQWGPRNALSPWYPYIDFQKVQQEKPGEWGPVIEQVAQLVKIRADAR